MRSRSTIVADRRTFLKLRPACSPFRGRPGFPRHADGPAWAVEFGGPQGLVEIGLVLDVALDGVEPEGQQLGGIVALHGIDIRITSGLVLEGSAEAGVLGVVEPVAVVQSRFHPLGGRALRFERAFGEKARAAQRHLQAGRGVLLDELNGAAAGEEGSHHVHAEAWDLRQ
jgi:hypothetical protein